MPSGSRVPFGRTDKIDEANRRFSKFANASEHWQDFKEHGALTEREIVFVFGRFRVQISVTIANTLT